MKNFPLNNTKFHLDDHIQNKKNKFNQDTSLEEVAQEFESLFVFQMLKNARNAKLSDGIFSNKGTETYQSLLDQEYSKTISKGQNFGIAEALVRQFSKGKVIK
tara:strand:+ start:1240 stop:1548 length:309 start_codon:yes stop_codon:yes gene_type:complete